MRQELIFSSRYLYQGNKHKRKAPSPIGKDTDKVMTGQQLGYFSFSGIGSYFSVFPKSLLDDDIKNKNILYSEQTPFPLNSMKLGLKYSIE